MLYPLYLLGTLAAGIPILIHMIHKRKAQKVLFPTIRFLKASTERTSRRQRIQDLLLLLLRMLLLILLALALAEPFLGSRKLGFGQQIHAVILLDNSFSMSTVHESTPRYEVAKKVASAVVDNLPEGSQAALLLACPPHGAPKPLLTGDRDALRHAIRQAPPSSARADMTSALERAYALLLDPDQANKAPTMEIYVLTDLQENAWNTPTPAYEELRKEDPQPSVILVDTGREDHRNIAIEELTVRGGARVRGRPVSIQARLHNFSAKPARLNVELYADGAEKANQQIELEGNTSGTASFNHIFTASGIHTGWVQIDDDSLAVDNRRDFAIEIQEHIPALILREAQGDIPQLDPAFFIAKALDPFGDDPSKPQSLVQTTLTGLSQLTHDMLREHKVVVLVDPSTFTRTQSNLLSNYVRRGGRLIIFCGPAVNAGALQTFLGGDDPTQALLPVTIANPPQGIVNRSEFKTLLIGKGKDHPAIAPFKGFKLFQTVKVYNYAPIEVPAESPTNILIELSDGKPFLLENACGSGRVILFSTTTDPDWSNLAASRFFLPLLHRLVYYLTERDEVEGTHLVGSTVPITLRTLSQKTGIKVSDPDGDVTDLEATPSGAGVRAAYTKTDKPGAYHYTVLDPGNIAESTKKDAAEAESAFVVTVDSEESDLAKVARGDLVARLDNPDVYFCDGPDELEGTIERMRKGVPLRNFLLYVVLFIAVFETFFANRVIPALQREEEGQAAPATA